ncbi:PREDICTED: protein PRY2-like [Acropora digitifera]|uniref:protein PRY2-like n=1 Tax=Acropora digitifera TaxID=70779 RepID=UPI00077A9C32|nr:PREDICTED: protein PRY2-like [Acropora digitifera]
MSFLLKLSLVCASFIICYSKPRRSADEPSQKISADSGYYGCETREDSYCSYWRSRGYCRYNSYYYQYMIVNCKKTCGFCGQCAFRKDMNVYCAYWASKGYCVGYHHYAYMWWYCPVSCGFCPESTTGPPPSTTVAPTTSTSAPSTSANSSSTTEPITPSNTTTAKPNSTAIPATTGQPTRTSKPLTTGKPSTTSNPSTTEKANTTSKSSTTGKPSTSSSPSTTGEPSTTSSSPTTVASVTTSNPVTTGGLTTTMPPPPPTSAENGCLKAHNDKRAIHNANPLIWNGTLTAHAQVWANQIAATGVVEHDITIQGIEGENIAWFKGQDDSDCIDSVTVWYDDEESLYDYNNPGFSPQTGHFTQVVHNTRF